MNLPQRSPIADRVAAVITRKARQAGMSDAAYFRQIMDGKAPRITAAEAGIQQKGKAIG